MASSLAARQTAQALGLAAEIEPVLADMDWGDWRGQGLEALFKTDPAAVGAWIKAPEFGAPGGETFAKVQSRISPWLDAQAVSEGRVLAVTHPSVLRAALAQVLDLSSEAAFRVDVAPLARLTLSFNGVWRFQGLATPEA